MMAAARGTSRRTRTDATRPLPQAGMAKPARWPVGVLMFITVSTSSGASGAGFVRAVVRKNLRVNKKGTTLRL